MQHDTHADWDITVASPGYKLAADVAFHDVEPDAYAGLVLSGGRAPEYLRYNSDLLRIVRHFCAQQRPIASICHGVEILAAADVLRGQAVATVAKCRLDAELSGGRYVNEEVVVSGNLVSARTWHDNPAWMRAYIKLLKQCE